MKEVKKGDIWMDEDGVPSHVVKVTKGHVTYWWDDIKNEEDPAMTTDSKGDFLRTHRLIERDGKPYVAPREFKEGAHYPMKLLSGEYGVTYYNNVKTFKAIGTREIYKEEDFFWIGEELKITWPYET